MRRAPRLLTTASVGLAAVLLSSCGTQVGGAPGATGTSAFDDSVSSGAPAGVTVDEKPATTVTAPSGAERSTTFDDRAAEVAGAWLQAGLIDAWREGLVPLAPLTTVPDFTARPELKAAYASGWVTPPEVFPPLGRADAEVTAGGESITVPLQTAEQAFTVAVPQRGPDCSPVAGGADGCSSAAVTGAELTTTTLRTNRGDVEVPAWAFTIDGLREPLVQVAVAQGGFTTPLDAYDVVPATDGDRSRGVVASQGLIDVERSTVTYEVGVGACDRDVVPRVVETADLVLVGATVETTPGGVCTDQLLIQPVRVQTERPVGDRPVVDVLTGTPLRPTSTPR